MARHLLSFLLVMAVAAPMTAQEAPGKGQAPRPLLQLAEEFREARRTFNERGDFSPGAIKKQEGQLAAFRARLDALPSSSWPVADRVDWYVLETELNLLEYELRIKRAPARDPGFYVQRALSMVPSNPGALTGEQAATLATRLQSIPALFAQARVNLTEGSATHADLALRAIEQVRGVRVQQSATDRFKWLARETAGRYPDVATSASAAADALVTYAGWIRSQKSSFTHPGHIGAENFNWYLHHVLMMPFRADMLLDLGERDLSRTVANLAFEENRNRAEPPLLPAETEADYLARVTEADRLTRRWLEEGNILTVPPDTPPFGATVPWKEGGTVGQVTPTHYWQAIQFRDPLPDHLHAGIPGHRYDGMVMRRHPRPIRAAHSDRGRSEGWGFYLEEMALMSGMFDERPRTRELIHNFQLFRYARMVLDIKMAAGDMTPQQAVDYQKHWVPLMEDQVAWSEGAGYYVNPTSGTVYTAGKYQLEMLVAELRRKLGDRFDLRAFHDRFMDAGPVPIALIAWELTGDDHELQKVLAARR